MRRRLRVLGRWLAFVLLAIVVLAGLGVWWVGHTNSFVRFALGQAASLTGGALEAGAARGTLVDGLVIERLVWHDGATRVEIARLAIEWLPRRLLAGELHLRELAADRVDVALAPGGEQEGGPPPALPERIGLPLQVVLDRIAIDELAIHAPGFEAPPIRRIRAGIGFGNQRWQVPQLSALVEGWGALQAQATVGARPPFAIEAHARAEPALPDFPGLPPLVLEAGGTLDAVELRLRLLAPAGRPAAGSPGPTTQAEPVQAPASPAAPGQEPAWATAETTVHPFEPVPLGAVALRLDGLEPQTLGLPGPHVQLSGELNARTGIGATGAAADAATGSGPAAGVNGNAAADSAARPTPDAASAWRGHLVVRNALPGPLDAARVPVATVETDFVWHDGRLVLDALDIDDATLAGRLAVDTQNTRRILGRELPAIEARLALHAVDLAAWHQAAWPTAIEGSLELDGTRLDLGLADTRRPELSLGAKALLEGEAVRVETLALRTPAGELGAQGSLAWEPRAIDLAGRFERVDPARLAAVVGLELPGAVEALEGLSGRWSASGVLAPEFALDSRLVLSGGRFQDRPLRVDWQGHVSRERLSRVALNATLGDLVARIGGDAGGPGDRLAIALRAPTLAALDPALTGSLDLEGDLRLAGLEPDALAGSRMSLRLRGRDVGYRGAAGEPVQARAVRASLEGTLADHRLEASVDDGPASGSARLHGDFALADGAGAPAWRWDGTIDALAVRAPLEARLAAPAAVRVEPGAVSTGAFTITAEGGRLAIERLALRNGRFDVAGRAGQVPVIRLADRFGLLPGAAPPGEIMLAAQWDLGGTSVDDLDGRASLEIATSRELAGEGAAELRLDDGRLGGEIDLRVPSLSFANPVIGPEWEVDGRLQVDASLGGTLREPRLEGRLEGRGLTLLQREFGWRMESGVLDAGFDGERMVLERLRLESGQGSVELDGRMRIADREGSFDLVARRLEVPFGPGQRVVVSGQTRLTSSATSVHWSGRIGVDEGLIELRGGSAPALPDDVVVIGAEELGIPEAAPRPARDSRGTRKAAADAPADTEMSVGGDLQLDLGKQLHVRGSGVDARLEGTLDLGITLPGTPRAEGVVHVRDGTYSAYGQKLTITRGRVVFNGPIDNPSLDIVAKRLGTAVEAGVAVTGTVLAPRVRLVSEPDVPDAQKLSWLVLGVGLDDARSGGQMAALQAAAATLFGDGSGSGGIAQSLGLDVLTIREASSSGYDTNFGATFPGLGGGTAGSSSTTQDVVAIGKRLGSRVSVTYEQGLRGVWSLLRLQYDLTRRLSLRAQTGTDTAIDLLYGFSFD